MTEEELNKLVKKLSLKKFQRPFTHQAMFNSHLKTTGGRYHLKDHHLDFNPKMLSLGQETFEKIVLHELCHYHLHLMHLPYQHKDQAFKQLLKQVGGLRYAPPLAENKKVQTKKMYHYQCQNCHQMYLRKRKINTRKFVCGKCQGILKEIEKNVPAK